MTDEERAALDALVLAVLDRTQEPTSVRAIREALAPMGVTPSYQQVLYAGYRLCNAGRGPVRFVAAWANPRPERKNAVALVVASAGLVCTHADLEAWWETPAVERS